MDIISLLIIFAVGVIAGLFGTLTGGGSLITIPAKTVESLSRSLNKFVFGLMNRRT